HKNYNMDIPTGQLAGGPDTRQIFAGFNEVNIYSSTEGSIGFLEAGTIVLENTDEGRQYSFTGRLAKKWDFGLQADVAYTYLNSKDYTSIPAEIAADAFQRNPVVGNPNFPMFSYSRYGLTHRAIASALYTVEYNKMATSFAMFFEAGKGGRYSYAYAGDLNQDAILNNDLIYIPKNPGDIHFGTVDENGNGVTAENADAQWTALNSFIEQDEYLSANRGSYAERNGAQLPWFTQMDLRIMQDFYVDIKGKKNTFQLSFDILNIGNLISSNFGVRQFARSTTPIAFNGLDKDNVPYFGFNTNLTESYVDDVSVRSKWQLQIGLRYIFN
ncbi:MAG: TonB-dependent receptor, partial [Candidatus Heimdallarchaeota archaeon]|nr:TonB-dependent receptor [Candidatus Heimdallarchaeota archaeon]